MQCTGQRFSFGVAILLAIIFLVLLPQDVHADRRQDYLSYLNRRLSLACYSGDVAEVKHLLDRGAQVNVRDRFGDTPLLNAVAERHPDVVRLLLVHGAHVDARDHFQTPLMLAALDDLETTDLLIKAGANINAVNRSGDTALKRTLLRESVKVKQRLREAGVHYGLVETAEMHDMADVRALLDRGADANSRGWGGVTPLMVAATETSPEMLDMLLKAGADPNLRDRQGCTALMRAAADETQHSEATILALLQAGAATYWRDRHGKTALLLAAEAGNAEIVTALLKGGADSKARDSLGRTALMCASKPGVLRFEAASFGRAGEAVAPLLAHGVDVNTRDDKGRTALLICMSGYLSYDEIFMQLRKAGADFTIADNRGFTPLLWAAYFNHQNQVKALLAHGAHVDIWDECGRTALMWTAKQGHSEIARQLLAAHANPSLKDFEEATALDLAETAHYSDVIALLKTFRPSLPLQTHGRSVPQPL